MNIYQFWGKAQPLKTNSGIQWHPLVYHSLDVAAVCSALLKSHRGFSECFKQLLGISEHDSASLICYLVCLHDIGKFAKKFQAKVPRFYPECFGDNLTGLATKFDHGAGGLRLFDASPSQFILPSGCSSRTSAPLIAAVTGHHGAPPERRSNENLLSLRTDFGQLGIDAAYEFISQVHELLLPPQEIRTLNSQRAKHASFAVAGLAVLADWIGSKQEWFPYREPVQNLKTYWSNVQDRAKHAVIESGVVPTRKSCRLDYRDLLNEQVIPSPMQVWAQEVKVFRGPALFMIEDETGSGKTEAALMLAHRLMITGTADGLYIALPTMATANAMFDRLSNAYRHLFASDTVPSLALAHSARDIHEGFRSAMSFEGRFEAPYGGTYEPDNASEITASDACAAWITDDRRRTFLADVGAGTIDQALLSVLPSRHQSLRLLGLMRRVLILDEVHAYDAYMQREIEQLLEFQAGLGGSTILLSATLPMCVRKRLTDAFAKGMQKQTNDATPGMDYPMVTSCTADASVFCEKIKGRAERARKLPVQFFRTTDEALNEIERETSNGKAILYIRNSVDDALDAHATLKIRGIEARLFHARFALLDRFTIENQVLETFGKRSTSAIRSGQVLIATQVVEQSLDLDFDVLISDLAPIDLLIQRAGRLWRHKRQERTGHPKLLVVGPEPIPNADEEWFSRAFPRAQYIYGDHARLWLTARVLEEIGYIESPGGLRHLIESVYGFNADEQLPDSLQARFFHAEGEAGAERGVATTNLLKFSNGYLRDGGIWDSDVRTPTRLNDDPQVTLRLACIDNGRIVPYAAKTGSSDELWLTWRLSEVNVSRRRVSGEVVNSKWTEDMKSLKIGWKHFESDKILVILEKDRTSDSLVGLAKSGGEYTKDIQLYYNPQSGLGYG